MTDFYVLFAAVVGTFVATLGFSQRIKDWFAGVPAHLRSDLSAIEASVVGKVKSAQAHVVADAKAQVAIPTPALQTSPPVVTVTAAVTAIPPTAVV